MYRSTDLPTVGWDFGALTNTSGSAEVNRVFTAAVLVPDSPSFGVTHNYVMPTSGTDANSSGVEVEQPVKVRQPCTIYCDIPFQQAKFIIWLFSVIVIPSVSLVGLFGNISSILVLYRQGLNKSSNILLMAMAVADIFFLLGTNNILDNWRTFYKTRISYDQARAFYFVHMFQNFSMELGNGMSVLLAVLVTLERMVAVYLPLKFTSIIRPWRTRIAVVLVLLIALFKAGWGFLVFEFFYNEKRGVPRIKWTAFYQNQKVFFTHLMGAYDYILGFIPVMTVCVGCILIGVKVSIAAANRAKMLTSSGGERALNQKQPRNSRTTLTLLSVCVLFTCTLGVGFCLETLMTSELTWKYYILRYKVTFLLYAINSSSNFIIYVGMNKNFRDTYVSIFMPFRNVSTDQKSQLVKTPTSLTMS
ncbi:hypothetical protein RRG08_039131 [Elysia crispata]|uniref:G-protein coupled receptors family 1 profile domain-containing protein n=1 Tax=Elysia crispata TaxID=231223 RepID=A0AAE0YM57_9GAST|nr:hypothetical protein RRG08_039131 [Elysia crispata]